MELFRNKDERSVAINLKNVVGVEYYHDSNILNLYYNTAVDNDNKGIPLNYGTLLSHSSFNDIDFSTYLHIVAKIEEMGG